jgi:uncharacterized protein (DUF2141 family)
MKHFGATVFALAIGAAGAAHAGDVVVELKDVQGRPGALLATLQTEAEFMKGAGRSLKVEPKAGALTLTFKDVPPGEYVFSALHDEDGNGRMKSSEIGIPAEGWAMTKGETLGGPPVFALVKVSIPAEGARLNERMFYWDGKPPVHCADARPGGGTRRAAPASAAPTTRIAKA